MAGVDTRKMPLREAVEFLNPGHTKLFFRVDKMLREFIFESATETSIKVVGVLDGQPIPINFNDISEWWAV